MLCTATALNSPTVNYFTHFLGHNDDVTVFPEVSRGWTDDLIVCELATPNGTAHQGTEGEEEKKKKKEN